MNLKSFNLLLLLAILFPLESFAQKLKVPDVASPKLVECKTEETCDRDPKHLEDFVAKFYEWLVFIEKHLEKNDKKSDLIYHKREQIILNNLTPELYNHLHTVSPYADDYVYDPMYCDNILCAQDYYDGWMSGASAKLTSINKNTADLILTLPIPKETFEYDGDFHIAVKLKVTNNEWKIDNMHVIEK